MTLSRKVSSKFQVVAYDPMKPPKGAPVVFEVFRAGEHGDEEEEVKVGEMKLTKDEIFALLDEAMKPTNRDVKLQAQLKKAGVLKGTYLTGGGDGDFLSNMSLEVGFDDNEDMTSLIYVRVKKNHEEALEDIEDEHSRLGKEHDEKEQDGDVKKFGL